MRFTRVAAPAPRRSRQRRTVTATGGASSKRAGGDCPRIAAPRDTAPPDRRTAFLSFFSVTCSDKFRIVFDWSPMFVAALATHAKITDRGRGKKPRSASGEGIGKSASDTDSRVCTRYAENQRYETVRRAIAPAPSAAPSKQAGFRGDGKPRNQQGRRFACPTREPGEAAS